MNFDDSSFGIATNLVKQAPDLGKLTQTPWSQVNESENEYLHFQFDSSVSGTKDIQNSDKPIDFVYFNHQIYGT